MERVADYIIRKINEAGVGYVFLVTGRGILYLTDAVAKNKNITPVSTYHEQGASYAAMAYASTTDGIAACLVSTGCASTNAITACLCAYQDNLPVIFISGNNQLNENTRHTGVQIRTYGSQEADIISVVKSVTKYAVMLEDANTSVYEIEKAIYIANEGRKGPVWIDIPLDVQNMRIEESEVRHFTIPKSAPTDISSEVNEVLNDLNKAVRPVVLIGGGARGAEDDIKKLAEKFGIPVVCSPAASDIYGTSNKLSIGTVGSLGGSRAGNLTVQNSDFVLVIGSKLCSQLTGNKKNFVREGKIIVVDIDETEHNKNGVKIDRIIISDGKIFLENLLKSDIKRHDASWAEKCVHWKTRFSIKNEEFVRILKENNEIDLYSLMDTMNTILPNDATVITDAGFEELIVPSAICYKDGQRCLFPVNQGAMGYAIPAVIGAFTAGRKNILCIVGDGSIMMNIQELQIIKLLNIPVKILVINNGMYAVIRKRQKDLFRNRTIGNDPYDGVPEPDFSKIAECFGFGYRKITSKSHLNDELFVLFDEESIMIEIMCTHEQKYLHESYALNERRKLVHRPIEDMSPFLPRNLMREEMVIDMLEE